MQPPASLPGLPEISPVEPIEQMGQKKVVAGKQTRDEWDFLQVKTPIPQPQPSNADHATNSNLHPVDPKLTSGKPDTDPPGKGPLKRPELVPGKRYMLDDLR